MNLQLRRTLPADIPYVVGLEQAEENRTFILPWPEERHHWVLTHPDFLHLIIQGQDREGFLILAGLTNSHRSIEFQRIVIEHKGKGIGRATLRLVQQMAFGELKAHRLWLDVKVHNERARLLYLSEGFKEEGILRECLKSGDYYDSLRVMSILESEWEKMVSVHFSFVT